MRIWLLCKLEPWLGRPVLSRPHICPYDAGQLDGRICNHLDLMLEVESLGLVRHIHTRALHIELPAVVHTAQAVLLVPSKE